MVCPAWLAANYLFNLSLDYTSVAPCGGDIEFLLQASNSMFSTTSNLWTMLFSVCFLGERMNPLHVVAVILTMAGRALRILVARVRLSHGGHSRFQISQREVYLARWDCVLSQREPPR